MVELEYLGYGGTSISRIWWNYDIKDMVELGCVGSGGVRLFRMMWTKNI